MFKAKKLIVPIVIGIAAGLVIASGVFFLKLNFYGKFPAQTSISGIDISYKTPQEAKILLSTEVEKYLSTPLTIISGDKTTQLTPADLGINLLVDETIRAVVSLDTTKMSFSDWLKLFDKKPKEVEILVRIDDVKALDKMDLIFGLPALSPVPATFYFEKGKRLAIRDEKEGLTLNKESFFGQLKQSAKRLTPVEINLILDHAVPGVTKQDLEAQQETIKKQINRRLTLEDPIYSDDYNVSLAEHLDWIVFTTENGLDVGSILRVKKEKPLIKIEIDQKKLDEYIDAKISKWLDKPAQPVNIYTSPDGKVVIEGKGANGLKVQRTFLKKAMELALAQDITKVPIPVFEIAPDIKISDDLRALGIKERIGIGHTSYYGSPANRVFNIKTGATRFNGTVIAPDEIFNFNKTLGPVDASTGYREELVIKPEGTIPEYGGGICQLSTTVYRAALFSGLPINERNQHSYAVTYYSQILGHGLDATVYLGGPNLKFTNDTGSSILMQAYVENNYELYVVFYGTKDGRSVKMDGPYLSNHRASPPTVYQETTKLKPGEQKVAEKAHPGFDALWYRYLTSATGETKTETISTKYRAMPTKIMVGVANLSQPPAQPPTQLPAQPPAATTP